MLQDRFPASFHPLVRTWFTETYGEPTGVQAEAWPLLAEGEHLLALAPTGSGKTLTGFLAAISRFIDQSYPADALSVLYVSPLKALNEDIRRNLLEPIRSLGDRFAREGLPFPEIRVETRSGDTPQSERRRFLVKPPSILALTPESLAIILLNPRGRQILSGVRYLILDEIHAALGTKRGTFLACQIDRLALIAGEFQRVGLSATVYPPERAAEFVAGVRRRVRIVSPPAKKRIDFMVDFPPVPREAAGEAVPPPDKKADRYGPRYAALIAYILERLAAVNRNRAGEEAPDGPAGSGASPTILVFTDSRRRAERIAFLLNREAGDTVACAHHGSLSLELRRAVERRLAEGRIPCVVATGSLELGIDIGGVEEVILAGSPGSSASALQRIGRSGHGVGRESRGRLIPFNGPDLIQAAALGGAIEDREIEETLPIMNPQDILAQVILELCAEQKRYVEELYGILRGFYAFQTLSRSAYDQVIRMLTGRYPGAEDSPLRIRELKPRLYLDALTGELRPAEGLLLLLYTSGGVIVNRGYYSLRLPDGVKIGELDEEFVWERRIGDRFDFGARSWSITAIGAEAVEVVPLESPSDYAPFWKADPVYRSPLLVRRILELFDAVEQKGGIGPDTPLGTAARLSAAALGELGEFIRRQREAQGGLPLPGLSRLPVELIDNPLARGDIKAVLLHSFRGGRVNYPLSLAMAEELEEHLKLRVEVTADDNGILLSLPAGEGPEPAFPGEALIRGCLLRLGEGRRGEELFRARLESSGVFGAAFREAAERSLLLPKAAFGRRSPLWITRQRSKRLFDAVAGFGDFPAVAEAWRSCLADQFDMEGFRRLLEDIREGALELSFFRTTKPSPFARDLVWKETNTFMYVYDEQPGKRGVSLSDQVIAEALGDGARRPPLPAGLIRDFCSRLRREAEGWAPEDGEGLREWVKERIAIPQDEWETLFGALPRELQEICRADPGLGGSLCRREAEGRAPASPPSWVHREWLPVWRERPLEVLGPWLRYEGPVSIGRIAAVFGVSPAEAEAAADALAETGDLVRGIAVEAPGGTTGGTDPAGGAGGTDLVCDRENLELLLRLLRKKARPALPERPAALLSPFLARRQGILPPCRGNRPGTEAPDREPPWKSLSGCAAPAALWEGELFPVRYPGYTPDLLDREIAAGRLLWYGADRERVAFCLPDEPDLVFSGYPEEPFAGCPAGFLDRPRDFWELKEALGRDNQSCVKALWEETWKGRLSADSFEPVRRGIAGGFAKKGFSPAGLPEQRLAPPPGRPGRHIPRALRNRWQGGPPVPGKWFSLATDYAGGGGNGGEAGAGTGGDTLDEEGLNRDRVRLLLRRWGILARPLLEREEGPLLWGKLLPTIRRMELAGELLAGRFFAGINSLQFAGPDIAGELTAAEAEGGVYWMNAADPASPAGLAVTGLDRRLPSRISSARICFRGAELVARSGRGGKDLEIFIPPGDPSLGEILEGFILPRRRAVNPRQKMTVETVNGEAAGTSEYADALKALGFIPDRGKLILW
ncbi:MAG: DEAD/DEAH box helicase [Spirochaetaceae bacterium]|jgi:ATP-dependent Lhr-like helicase|nr:DEAD/DEAH box helicase [Spirochaetaceae bacterium]